MKLKNKSQKNLKKEEEVVDGFQGFQDKNTSYNNLVPEASARKSKKRKNTFNKKQTEDISLRKIYAEGKQFPKQMHEKVLFNPHKPYKQGQGIKKKKQQKQQRQKSIQKNEEQLNFVPNKGLIPPTTDTSIILNSTANKIQQVLKGKVSILWVFVSKEKLPQQENQRLKQIFKRFLNDDAYVPLFKCWQDINQLLELEFCAFKIVCDLSNAEECFKTYQNKERIIEYYIYNNEGTNGIQRAVNLKKKNQKIRGICTEIGKIIDQTEEEVEQDTYIYKMKDGSYEKMSKPIKLQPSFLKLSGSDKSLATSYRLNLFWALKSTPKERKLSHKEFVSLVIKKYPQENKKRSNLSEYNKMKHEIQCINEAKQIITFYTHQCFYYRMVNLLLRFVRTLQEFRPCMLPIYQMYTSIKLLHQNDLKVTNNQIQEMTLYRGVKLRERDCKALSKEGSFIEIFGFMSTSKSLRSAQDFVDNKGLMFVIHVPKRKISTAHFQYNHGFVDINKHNLAAKMEGEQEVLFNALNVFKVGKTQKKGDITFYHLHYGAIFELLQKKHNKTPDQKETLVNYQFCTQTFNSIKDIGDVYIHANELTKAKEFYQTKIKGQQHKNNSAMYLKLARVYQMLGDIEKAETKSREALQLCKKYKQQQQEMVEVYAANAEIELKKEDYVEAENNLNQAIEKAGIDSLQKGIRLRERGQMFFKTRQIKQALQDFQESQKNLLKVLANEQNQRQDNKELGCFQRLKQCLFGQKKHELEEIGNKYDNQMSEMNKGLTQKIEKAYKELIKVTNCTQELADYTQNKELGKMCSQKSKTYLQKLAVKTNQDPYYKAEIAAINAIVDNSEESQKILKQAVQQIQKESPFDPKIAEYSVIMANQKKEELAMLTAQGGKGMSQSSNSCKKYDREKRKELCQEATINYQKTIAIIKYNSKEQLPKEVIILRNEMGEMELGVSNFQKTQSIAKNLKQEYKNVKHSQLSKTSILLAKIALGRGELKYAFQMLQTASTLLEECILKIKDNQTYKKIFLRSDYHLEICMLKAKTYNKQKKHQLAIKQLDFVEQIFKKEGIEFHRLLPEIYEQKGEVQFSRNNFQQFKGYFQQALNLRQMQMGGKSVLSATSYCNYSKFLLAISDQKLAQFYLNKAVQIFNGYSSDHPSVWVIKFILGMKKDREGKAEEANKLFFDALSEVRMSYSLDHIVIKKVQLRCARSCQERGEKQFLNMLEELQKTTKQDLRVSMTKCLIAQETDDEKVSLSKFILKQLQNAYQDQIRKSEYKKKYEELRKTYKIMENQTK